MKNLLNLRKDIPVTIKHHHHPIISLQRELDNAMSNFYDWFEPFNIAPINFENLDIKPAIDIIEDGNQFKVEVEMPGMGEENIQVSVDNGLLKIKGEKSTSNKDEGKDYMIREISYGNYERTVALPDYVDADKAKASFKKGMLWVTFPKKAGSKNPITIEVAKG